MAPRSGKRRNRSGLSFGNDPLEEGSPESAVDVPRSLTASPQVWTSNDSKSLKEPAHLTIFERMTLQFQGTLLKTEGWNMLLLSTLYLMQGVPLGLTMGSMPFLLQSTASYTQIGIFSVASYPYSFKLFWSPIVDSIYSLAFGRRKSWVVGL